VGATLWALLYTLFGASVGVVAGGLLG